MKDENGYEYVRCYIPLRHIYSNITFNALSVLGHIEDLCLKNNNEFTAINMDYVKLWANVSKATIYRAIKMFITLQIIQKEIRNEKPLYRINKFFYPAIENLAKDIPDSPSKKQEIKFKETIPKLKKEFEKNLKE